MNFTFSDIFLNPRYLVAIMGVLVILLIVFLVTLAKLVGEEKTPWKLAGKRGESEAEDLIGHVLYEDDYLFRNVSVEVKKSHAMYHCMKIKIVLLYDVGAVPLHHLICFNRISLFGCLFLREVNRYEKRIVFNHYYIRHFIRM